MKNVVRKKIISFAVTQEMYDFIVMKAGKMGMTPSTFCYQLQKNLFGEEMQEYYLKESTNE